jgi:hypothetical protein
MPDKFTSAAYEEEHSMNVHSQSSEVILVMPFNIYSVPENFARHTHDPSQQVGYIQILQ